MEKYICDLDHYLECCGISVKKTLKIVKELIIALKLIHETGYCYNDIKPENIMV